MGEDEYRRRGPPPSYGRGDYGPRRDYDRGYGGGGGYGLSRRPYYDRGAAPPPKRLRDWVEDTYDPQMPARRTMEEASEDPTKKLANPVLMSFKQFLATQDDSISDEEAIKKYNEYKLEHRRRELHAFFIAHKDEEWFAEKYHPEKSVAAKEEYLRNVAKRHEVFLWLQEQGYVDRARVEHDNQNNILKLLDALVVKLEGGDDDDVADAMREYDDRSEVKQEKRRAEELRKDAKRVEKIAEEEGVAVNADTADPSVLRENTDDKEGEDVDGAADEEDKKSDDGRRRDIDEADSAEEGEMHDEKEEGRETERDFRSAVRSSHQNGVSEERPRKSKKLHKTSSIFLRTVAPHVKRSEIEELCKRFPGYLRVGLADPNPERGYQRRGWISFRRDVNIKEICWNLSTIKIRDCDFGAIVNKDLTKRMRNVNGMCSHRSVAQVFDARANLYQSEELLEARKKLPFDLPPGAEIEMGIRSGNPLLSDIEDLLVEEACAEEDELLGRNDGGESAKVQFERDEQLLRTLDRIIIYLRVVHSVDFYNHTDYPHEDHMPNRAGLIHVRGPRPSAKDCNGVMERGQLSIPQSFIDEFIQLQAKKMQPLISIDAKLSASEIAKLGQKDPDKEVEAFITANCVELSTDKWLCPLSGKKFRGPEFIRKHIIGKHSEKLEEVSQEVKYFNNYLADPNRPQPPQPSDAELKKSQVRISDAFDLPQQPPPLMGQNAAPPPGYRDRSFGGGDYRGPPPRPQQHERGPPRTFGFNSSPRTGGGSWQQPPSRMGGRELISYKDLDAPDDVI